MPSFFNRDNRCGGVSRTNPSIQSISFCRSRQAIPFLVACRLLALAGLAIGCAAPALKAEDMNGMMDMKAIKADQIAWQNDTAIKGIQFANLVGDPAKAELVVSLVKVPPHTTIPLHTHPWSEVLTILSGALGNASSDTDQGELLPAGAVLVMPANHAHRVFTTDQPAEFQFFYTGPFEITFVNPADDPRKKAE